HVGALARVRDRDGPPDARVAARDERGHALEPPVASVGLLAVIGGRPRLVGEGGLIGALSRKALLTVSLPRVHETLHVGFGHGRFLLRARARRHAPPSYDHSPRASRSSWQEREDDGARRAVRRALRDERADRGGGL